MSLLYLDYNATTPIAPEVQAAMKPYLSEFYGNPSSSHQQGTKCKQAINQARQQVADLIGASSEEILFTSGGTESNNTVFKGLAFRDGLPKGHLITSAIEHPAISAPAKFLERLGCEVSFIGCDQYGVVDIQELKNVIRPDTFLVSIMHANNEIGTLQPIQEISAICREHKILLHTDAAQSMGKVPVDVNELGVDFLSIAGHKLYAPKGVGALYIRQGISLEPLMHGAGHESGRRAGTENTAYYVGLGRAAQLVKQHLEADNGQLAQKRDSLYELLQAKLGDRISFNGHPTQRLPNTLSVNFQGVIAGELLARIPNLCASTGAACHSNTAKLSDTTRAIGIVPEIAKGTMRLSLGIHTTDAEIHQAAELLASTYLAAIE